MNINYKQSQFELFPGSPGSCDEATRPRYLFTHLTLSLENLVVAGIVSLVVLIVAYSFGVEKGKLVAEDFGHQERGAATAVSVNNRQPTALEEKQPSARQAPAETVLEPVRMIAEVTAGSDASRTAAEAVQKVAENISGKYTIQVASFRKEKHAREEADVLKQKGYEILVLPKGDYSIVCVGKFENKDEAKSFSKKLKQQYKDFLIRRL
jgi:cell division septation protein DedD